MKNREELISYCLTFKDTYPDQPFHDPNWTVIRHRGSRKVFAWIFEREGRTWVNVKCSPEWRDFWRQVYPAVIPAYHLNKTHWNSIILDGTIPEEEVKRMIGESYDLTAVHTVMSREVFSCVFCTKIPSFTARRFLAGCEQQQSFYCPHCGVCYCPHAISLMLYRGSNTGNSPALLENRVDKEYMFA